MYQKQKLHAGLQADCKVCTPEQKKKRVKFVRPKIERKAKTLEGVLRRQLSEDIGDAELTKDQLFTAVQKFGLAAPKIDRKVTKPSWMGERQWNQLLNEWRVATKGLVESVKAFQPRTPQQRTTSTTKPAVAFRRSNQSRSQGNSTRPMNSRGIRTPRPLNK